ILLLEEKKRLKTDDEYIEKLAREKYKMTKKGEKITRIVRSSGSDR
ncbi:septum formation initiator family protein, partial [bacterium]|nr:septum formation initiator family protein [bacterium]